MSNLSICKPILSGTLWNIGADGFRKGEENYQFTPQQWQQELDALEAIGINTILLNGTSHAYDLAVKSGSNKPLPNHDLLEFLCTQCDKRNIKLIFETYVEAFWWEKNNFDKQIENNRIYIHELHKRYGHHESFGYWYLGYEIYIRWGQQAEVIRNLYRSLSQMCHEISPKKQVVLSPFFMLDTNLQAANFKFATPDVYQQWWAETLDYCNIDILALQDSGGEHFSFSTIEDRRPFFNAMHNACKLSNTEFWGNVESAEIEVESFCDYAKKYGYGTWVNDIRVRQAWKKVSQEKLEQKLLLASQYCQKLITWGYREFLRPSLDPQAKKSYEQYQQYYLTNHV